jgi:pimeloyl-ACP methyl ester carboxylesterase
MEATVLFIHGMFLTGRSWASWCARFEGAGYHCLAPSWPGRKGEARALREHPDPLLRTLTLTELISRFEAIARAERTPPILIGHSMGGLVVQALLSRGAGCVGVAIDSAPPFGIRSLAFSHLRANAPMLWPGASPIVPTLASWRYAFWHTGGADEVARAFDAEVVPESRLVGKGPLGKEGAVDFSAPRPPLLMIAGELDHIIPASLNRTNAARYHPTLAPTELVQMKGRTHYLCGQPGWEEVADTALAFVGKHVARADAVPSVDRPALPM